MRQFDVFTDTNNIAALKKCAASTLSGYARELASNCLRIMEVPIPVKARVANVSQLAQLSLI
jgi:N-glycosylase/DNA lyase